MYLRQCPQCKTLPIYTDWYITGIPVKFSTLSYTVVYIANKNATEYYYCFPVKCGRNDAETLYFALKHLNILNPLSLFDFIKE